MDDLPRKILVRGPNWLGDQVMAHAFYEQLRLLYPQAKITLLTLDNLEGSPVPHADAHWTMPREGRHWLRVWWPWAHRIRQERFDLGISLPFSLSSAWLMWVGRIPHRVGFATPASQPLYTSSVVWPGRQSGQHKSRLYGSLLDHLQSRSCFFLPEAPVVGGERENTIVVAPGAALPLREWPGFPELLRQLRQQYWAFRIVVVGTDDRWHRVIRRMDDAKIEDWVGRTGLSELIELCEKAKLVIANDSGVAHVAATWAQAPLVVLFGPGDPDYVRPRGSQVAVVRLRDLDCSPCESVRCSERWGYQACLQRLTVDAVMESVEAMLA